jgi:hypothetical protein
LEKSIKKKKMQYPKGRFLQHLNTAVKFQDSEMIMDLFADQVTDLAIKYPEALNAALKNAGVKVTDSKEPKYLVGLVADNWDNGKLIQNISLLIADTTSTKAEGDYMGVGGIVQGVGSIVQGAATIAAAAIQPKVEKEKNKGKMFDYLAAKSAARAEMAKAESFVKVEAQKNKATLLYVGVGIAVVAIIGIGIYAYKQSIKTVTV